MPILSLAPGEVKRIRLTDYQQADQIPSDANWATVRLSYAGQRSDLVAVAASYDKTGRYGLQTPFSEDLSRLWAGGMWHVDPTHNTLIMTGNGGSEPTTAEVTLFYNGGKSKYRMEKMLASGQQLWLDLGHLIHDQVADSDGNTLPPDTMSGSYELRDLDHAYVGELYEGKLVIDKTYGHAAYGCGSCCGYNAVEMSPGTFDGPPGIDNSDYIYATDGCAGGQVDVTGDGYGWGTTDSSVATLPNSTLHTVGVGSTKGSALAELQFQHPPSCPDEVFEPQQSVRVQAPTISSISPAQGLVGTAINVTITGTNFASGASVSAGSNISVSNVSVSSSTQITATFTPTNSSSAGGNQGITVSVGGQTSNSKNFYDQVPTALQVVGTPATIATGSPGGCTTSYNFGIEIDIEYQVLDQESPAQGIQSSAMTPWEDDTFPTGSSSGDTCANSPVADCTLTTASNGTYHDAPVGACVSQVFSTSETQAISMIVGSAKYAVRTNNITINSSSSGHGTVTNGSDINVTR
jgi:hypothetical protein